MTAKKITINWNNFTGGITDKLEGGPEGTYYQGYNVKTRDFYATSTGTHRTLSTYSSFIRGIYEAGKHNNSGSLSTIVWLDNGQIYLNGTLVNQISTVAQRQGEYISYLDQFGQIFLYFFPYGGNSIVKYIHKVAIDGTINTENFADYVLGGGTWKGVYSNATSYSKDDVVEYSGSYYKSKTNTNTGNIPPNATYWEDVSGLSQTKMYQTVLNDGSKIIFSYNNCLYLFDGTLVTNLRNLDKGENIVAITKANGYYRIYSNYNDNTSYVYRISETDLTTGNIELENIFNGYGITSVVDNGNYDYFTAGGSLYYYPVSNIEEGEVLREVGVTALIRKGPYVYLNYINKNNDFNLATFGKKPGFPTSLEATKGIPVLVNSKATIDYNSNNLVYACDKVLYSDSSTSGVPINSYIESLELTGANIRDRKAIEELEIKFKNATAGCEIKIEAQIDSNGVWHQVWQGINLDSTSSNYGIQLPYNSFETQFGDFNTIRFKVTYISDGNSSFRFYGITLTLKEGVGV